mmetsp:Transcript_84704/g.226432  ORF Transcript_84704/g.226432 Transcript_84704/m.226432 type:complete len:291 (-) Transcript_84704:1238-2110(-)
MVSGPMPSVTSKSRVMLPPSGCLQVGRCWMPWGSVSGSLWARHITHCLVILSAGVLQDPDKSLLYVSKSAGSRPQRRIALASHSAPVGLHRSWSQIPFRLGDRKIGGHTRVASSQLLAKNIVSAFSYPGATTWISIWLLLVVAKLRMDPEESVMCSSLADSRTGTCRVVTLAPRTGLFVIPSYTRMSMSILFPPFALSGRSYWHRSSSQLHPSFRTQASLLRCASQQEVVKHRLADSGGAGAGGATGAGWGLGQLRDMSASAPSWAKASWRQWCQLSSGSRVSSSSSWEA